jgi:membrane protease YdiL (CAAX protease family)
MKKTSSNQQGFLFDLLMYIAAMFLIREVKIPNTSFLINGLFWTLTCLAIATWRMKARGISWRDLGLTTPKSYPKTIAVAAGIFITVIVSIIIFNIVQDQFLPATITEEGIESSASKFGDLKGNWWLFLSILPLVLLESALEELLDRGFLITWLERVFSWTSAATVIAVVFQAIIFGFRHSHDLSERSITVGIIGLVMGIAYVKFGRNLWAIIIAHCILNTFSMIDRVL